MAAGNSPIQSSTLPPACPRCDYDQSGEVSRWTDTCPLEGVCSECGLAFEWGDALVPDRARVRGFVEHAERKRVFSTAWRTWWWALRPWYFWGRVRLEHRPRVERMLWWMFMVLAVPRLVQVVVVFGAQIALYSFVRSGLAFGDWVMSMLSMLFDDFVRLYSPSGGPGLSLAMSSALIAFMTSAVAYPAVLLCLPWTRRSAKVRKGHLARACIYSLAPLAPLMVLSLFTWILVVLAQMTGGPPTPGRQPGLTGPQEFAQWCLYRFIELKHYVPLVGFAWLQVWWWFALSRGFRFNGAVRLWLILAVCAGLSSLVALAFTHPTVAIGLVDFL